MLQNPQSKFKQPVPAQHWPHMGKGQGQAFQKIQSTEVSFPRPPVPFNYGKQTAFNEDSSDDPISLDIGSDATLIGIHSEILDLPYHDIMREHAPRIRTGAKGHMQFKQHQQPPSNTTPPNAKFRPKVEPVKLEKTASTTPRKASVSTPSAPSTSNWYQFAKLYVLFLYGLILYVLGFANQAYSYSKSLRSERSQVTTNSRSQTTTTSAGQGQTAPQQMQNRMSIGAKS